MNFSEIIPLVGATIGGGAIASLLQHIRERRKSNAEGALLEEEVTDKSWGRFQAEIARLDRAIAECEADKIPLNKRLTQQDNEIAYMRHRMNNEVMSTEALLMIVESHADQLPPAIIKALAAIRKMRTEQHAYLAIERAAVVENRIEITDKFDEEYKNESS